MAKIKLGERPKNFKRIVKFPMHDGTEGSIECVYKYRTRTEFGEFVDGIVEAAKLKAPAPAEDGEVKFSMADLMAKTAGSNAEYLLQVLDGWNVEGAELTLANLQQLADELPGAASAIMDTYRAAVTEGRLGN